MFEMTRTVATSCCDSTATQSPISTLEMLQDCSMLWLKSEPEYAKWVVDNGLSLILTSRQLDILRRPEWGETLRISTNLFDIKGPLGYRNTFIYDEAGEPVAKSWTVGPIMDLAAGKLAKVPADIKAVTSVEDKRDMEYLNKKIADPNPELGEELQELGRYTVRRCDIDMYHHMNNVAYVRLACEYLPEDFAWNRMRVEYKSQAKLGNQVIVLGCDTAGAVGAAGEGNGEGNEEGSACAKYVRLADAEGNPFVNLEFSKF